MVWIILTLSVFVILVVNGTIHQVRIVLYNELQAELAEKRRREIEEHKKMAAEKIRDMLAEKKQLLGPRGLAAAEANEETTQKTDAPPPPSAKPKAVSRAAVAAAS
ncbi:MAG: hypothetical protein JXL80_03485 [Planctomycetes bacterium]|nr:hypothetical protein [Planctomycetota bacterium]